MIWNRNLNFPVLQLLAVTVIYPGAGHTVENGSKGVALWRTRGETIKNKIKKLQNVLNIKMYIFFLPISYKHQINTQACKINTQYPYFNLQCLCTLSTDRCTYCKQSGHVYGFDKHKNEKECSYIRNLFKK